MNYLLTHTIENSALRYPDKAAFIFNKESISYSELVCRSRQLANYLFEIGIQKGDRVGILLPRCLETSVAIYGILQAGAAYVPLDPNAPPHRTALVLRDCSISILISDEKRRTYVGELIKKSSLTHVVGLDTDDLVSVSWSDVQQRADTPTKHKILAGDLAYVMYTSGTTGMPKGIMHTHYSGLNYAKLASDLYEVNENDIVANHCALHYDISTFGYFAAPLSHATTVIVSDAHTIMPASMSQLIQDQNITIWYSVPIAIIHMVQRGLLEKRKLDSLRWMLFGGEPMPPKFINTIFDIAPHIRCSNVYGPAEVNQCTYFHIDQKWPADQALPLGYVWGNTDYMILDQENSAVDRNSKGELVIRSATMMSGYWNNEELTMSKYYVTRSSSQINEIYYRTGDLVSEDSNGILHFHGRLDRQVKIKGHRVELNDIETHLVNISPGIIEAAVFTVNIDDNVKQIQAAIISSNDALNPKAIQQKLSTLLPKHYIPEVIHFRNEIPRTSAGKMDYTALENEYHLT